jgi:hypothetical protein
VAEGTGSGGGPYSDMSQPARGGETPLPFLLTERLILKTRVIGRLHGKITRIRTSQSLSNPLRLVVTCNISWYLFHWGLTLSLILSMLTYLSEQMKDPRRQVNKLREMLLREKIKKMRTSSTDSTKCSS